MCCAQLGLAADYRILHGRCQALHGLRDACVSVCSNYMWWTTYILKNSIFRDITLCWPLKLNDTLLKQLQWTTQCYIPAVWTTDPKYILHCFIKCIQANSNKPPLYDSEQTLPERCWKRITYNHFYMSTYSMSDLGLIQYIMLVGNIISLQGNPGNKKVWTYIFLIHIFH